MSACPIVATPARAARGSPSPGRPHCQVSPPQWRIDRTTVPTASSHPAGPQSSVTCAIGTPPRTRRSPLRPGSSRSRGCRPPGAWAGRSARHQGRRSPPGRDRLQVSSRSAPTARPLAGTARRRAGRDRARACMSTPRWSEGARDRPASGSPHRSRPAGTARRIPAAWRGWASNSGSRQSPSTSSTHMSCEPPVTSHRRGGSHGAHTRPRAHDLRRDRTRSLPKDGVTAGRQRKTAAWAGRGLPPFSLMNGAAESELHADLTRSPRASCSNRERAARPSGRQAQAGLGRRRR